MSAHTLPSVQDRKTEKDRREEKRKERKREAERERESRAVPISHSRHHELPIGLPAPAAK